MIERTTLSDINAREEDNTLIIEGNHKWSTGQLASFKLSFKPDNTSINSLLESSEGIPEELQFRLKAKTIGLNAKHSSGWKKAPIVVDLLSRQSKALIAEMHAKHLTVLPPAHRELIVKLMKKVKEHEEELKRVRGIH